MLTLGPGAEGFHDLGHGESEGESEGEENDEVDLKKQERSEVKLFLKQISSKMAAERQRTEFTWREARSMI